MPYTPDATNPTEPVDGRPAGSAAAEFRAIKAQLANFSGNGLFFNIMAYGAIGNGTIDDSAAIQAAINAAGEGKIVYFPKPSNHYFIGTTSLKIKKGQWWLGNSRDDSGASNDLATTIRYTGVGSAVYGIGKDTNTTTGNVRISNLRIIGHSSAVVLDMSGMFGSLIEFINIDSSNAAGIGILLGSTAGAGSGGGNCYYNTLHQVTLLNATGIGIKILQAGDTGTNDNRIVDGKNTCNTGIKFEGTGVGALNSGNVIQNISFENVSAGTKAIHCDTGVDNLISGCRIEHPGAGSLDFVFGTTGRDNVIISNHYGSVAGGVRYSDASIEGQFWYGRKGLWTPVITCGTPGNLAVGYSVQYGAWEREGKLVTVSFNIETSSFTHTTASGTFSITGLPFTVENSTNLVAEGTLLFQGITKANYTQFTFRGIPNDTTTVIGCSGSAQTRANLLITEVPTGGTVHLKGGLTYIAKGG